MALLVLLLPALLVSFSAAAAPSEGDWPLPVTFTAKDLENETLKDLKSRTTDYIRGGILAKDQIECKFGSQFIQEIPETASTTETTPTYITSSLTLWFKWEWRQAQRWTDAFGEYNFGPKDIRISCITPANGYFFDPTDCQFNLHNQYTRQTAVHLRKNYKCMKTGTTIEMMTYTPDFWVPLKEIKGKELFCISGGIGGNTWNLLGADGKNQTFTTPFGNVPHFTCPGESNTTPAPKST